MIAGRAVVTIDPLPEKKQEEKPIVQQPRKLRWENEEFQIFGREIISKSEPAIFDSTKDDNKENEEEKKDEQVITMK